MLYNEIKILINVLKMLRVVNIHRRRASIDNVCNFDWFYFTIMIVTRRFFYRCDELVFNDILQYFNNRKV